MHILILDDHPLFAEALKQVVQRLGGNTVIHAVETANRALDHIEARNYDLIMVDLHLPGLDGFGFMRLLKSRFILAPVIVVSATQEVGDIRRALKQGAMGFIPKASDAKSILAGIHAVLQGQIYLPDEWRHALNEEQAGDASKNRDALLGKLDISPRQFSILQQIEAGLSNKEIARKLFISESTVKTHVSNLMAALAAPNRTACIMEAQRLGLL